MCRSSMLQHSDVCHIFCSERPCKLSWLSKMNVILFVLITNKIRLQSSLLLVESVKLHLPACNLVDSLFITAPGCR